MNQGLMVMFFVVFLALGGALVGVRHYEVVSENSFMIAFISFVSCVSFLICYRRFAHVQSLGGTD